MLEYFGQFRNSLISLCFDRRQHIRSDKFDANRNICLSLWYNRAKKLIFSISDLLQLTIINLQYFENSTFSVITS